MTGSDIEALLNQCISGGVLTLKQGTNPLGSARIDALLGAVFGGTLLATPGSATVGASSVTYSQASLNCAGFLYYDKTAGVTAVLSFTTGSDGLLDCAVNATMPAKWALGDSFAALSALQNCPLNALVISSAGIAVSSTVPSFDALVSAELQTANSPLAQLDWLFQSKVSVSGPASFTVQGGQNYPVFSLASTQIQGPQISGFSFAVYLNLRCAMGTLPLADGSMPVLAGIDLTTMLETPALTLPVLISITSGKQTSYPVSLDPYTPVPAITSLDQLSGFAWNQSVALSTDTPLGQLSLKSLSIVFDAANKQLNDLQVTVDLGTNWTIVTNLKLVGLEAQLYVPVVWGGTGQPDTGSSFSISVTAEFLIVTADINVSIAYPAETVSLDLAPNTVIDINDFLNALAPGVSLPGSGDLQIITLSAMADIPDDIYTVTSAANGALTIIPGFMLTAIDFDFTYGKGSVESFQFGSEFTIADAPLYLNVTYAVSNWTIAGGSPPDQSIDLTLLVTDIFSIFGVQLPSDLPEIVLSQLGMTYQTKDGSFAFKASIAYVPGNDPILTKIEGNTDITYNGTTQQWTGMVSGTIVLDKTNNFTVEYDFKTDQIVSLSWTATDGASLGINDICHLFGMPNEQDLIPPDLDLALVQIIGKYDITTQQVVFECQSKTWGSSDIVVWNDKTEGWMLYFGVQITVDISLTDIPLIGKALASVIGEVTLEDIQADLASGVLSKAQSTAIAKVVDKPYPIPPPDGLPDGMALSMNFNAGGATTQISIGTGDSSGGAPTGSASGQKVPGAPGAGSTSVSTAPDGTKWFSLQKSFGPISIQKVGVRYSGGKLWALMNASIAAGGLEIDMLGLGVGSPLTTFDPSFTVDGIAVTLKEGPIAFSGGLVGTLEPLNLYGEIAVDFGPFSIGALAGYAEYQNEPSFFLYGVLNAPLGGPGFFFVTGLAAGFGFNRSLIVPDVSGVYDFPLVQWALGINAPSADPSGNIGAQVANTMDLLAQSGVIAPSIGEYWFAAGIRFTSYEVVDSFALLTFAFGNDFEIDLLGISTIVMPPGGGSPVAEAQLQLKATIQPATGLLGISGQLSPNSYVLSKDCKLTGGFAFYIWFSGPYAGEFVITLGGYSPNYTRPPYYPVVPRLGLNWQIGDCLTISGDLYFAITSSAVMAGGGMSAVWQAGDIRAWFSVEADFLMVFTPFHYYLSGSIELGASVRINLLFTHVTISIHLGVGVQLWGPSFSGEVDVDLSIVSFTISFGAGQQGGNTTIPWNDFVSQLLPSQNTAQSPAPMQKRRRPGTARRAQTAQPAPVTDTPPSVPAIVQIVALQGVTQTLSTEDGQLNWLVDGQTFQAAVQTSIPLKTYTLDGPGVVLAPPAQQPQSGGEMILPNTDFGVGPTGAQSTYFTSGIEISLTSTEDSVFDAVLVLSNIPKALWQTCTYDSHAVPQNVDPVNDTTISNALTGFTLIPTVAPPDQTPLPIPIKYLRYTIDPNFQSFSWSVPVVQTSDPFTDQTVQATIASPPATLNRPLLLTAMRNALLAVNDNVDVSTLADPASSYLLASPQLRYLGEAK